MTQKTQKSAALRATFIALCGNSIFGFSFMFSRMALQVATPFVMLMYRFCLAFLVLSAIVLWAARTRQEGWLRFRLSLRDTVPLLLLGLIQPVLYFLCESYGISLTNATVSGVIIALVPIVALIGGALFLGERPSLRQVLFSLLSITGVVVMTLQQNAGGNIRLLGVVLLIGAVISGTSFNLMSRKLSERFSSLERTYIMMLVAAVIFSALALWECRRDFSVLLQPLGDSSFLLSMMYLALLSSILAFLCINYAAAILPVSKMASFCNVTTVLSVFAGAVFLGESMTVISVIAAVVIIVGVFGVQRT